MGKILDFPGMTVLDIPVDRVLDGAKEHLDNVILCGYDKDGDYYFAGTFGDAAEILWLLEKCKQAILNDNMIID